MSAQLSTTFFSVANPEGRALRDAFMETLSREFNLAADPVEGAGQADVYQRCLQDDIVVFDASIEEGHNYDAATSQPTTLDRVLVVSRTNLPLNFYGLREGGAPNFPRRTALTNEEILKWLRTQIAELVAQPPRPDNRKKFFGSLRAVSESLNKREADWKARGRVFISYRSRHFDAVRELARRIERGDFHGGSPRTAFFLTPGEMVYEDEVLTELRHWQLVSMIDRRVGAADEMWLYETDDYYDSWWTRAEITTVAYRHASGIYAPDVRFFRPGRGELSAPPDTFLPVMSRRQKARMARWYANADPGMMAPESLATMRAYSQIPLLGRLPFFHDHVWSDDFWFANLLPCEHCAERAERPQLADLEAFLWLRDPKLYRLSQQQVEEGLARGAVLCPGCGTVYEIRQGPHSRYLWVPLRTGPESSHLLQFPIIRVERQSAQQVRPCPMI
ncbi:MAG: hypothetical protein WCD76_14250 [Pyrinomonadaceae bacterium]